MRNFIRTSLSLCALAALTLPTAAQTEITSGPVAFSIDLTEGVEAASVPVEWAARGREWHGTAPGLGVTVRQGPLEQDAIILRVTIANSGDERRLLEFSTVVAPDLDAGSARYWNGSWSAVTPVPGPQETGEPRPRGAWPLSAVGDASGATFMGITPDTLISYAEPTFTYAPDGDSRYRFHVRTVVDPDGEETFSLIVGRTEDVRWGFLQAVWQAYHDAFPEYAMPTDGTPDAIWGTSAEYQAWRAGIDRERLRRLDCTWDWCYVPFKRAGDMWCREDEWTYEPLAKPFSEFIRGMLNDAYDMGEVDFGKFRDDREAFFEEYGYDTGSLFYTPSGIWVEEQLAEEKFADALVDNDNMKTELSAWVTGYDDEQLVQPTGTSYGERLEEDCRLIAENLDIAGFAFDVCVAGQRNYSEAALQPLAGRSWDEQGVFFDLGISMVQQMQQIRGLNWGDAPFERGLIVGSGTSFTAWHVDGALLELTLTGQRRDSWEAMNMALGGKPGVIWKGYELRNVLQDPDGMPRADFLNVWAKLADYVNLKSFQWGMFPGYNYLPGMDKLQRDLPLLRECIRAGWQPVCPVDVAGDAELWMGRYGSGAGTHLALGNPTDDPIDANLTVHSEPLGDVDCVFVSAKYPGTPVTHSLADGTTKLSVACPMRRETVLQSVLGVRAEEPLECVASMEEDLDEIVTRVTITAAALTDVTLSIPERRGFEVAEVTLNGRPCRETGSLNPGENVLEITYQSGHFDFAQAALNEFPFLTEDDRPAFAIVSPEPDERAHARVSERFDRYFQYYVENALGIDEPVSVPVSSEVPEAGARVVLNIGAGVEGNGWSLEGDALTLNAPDEREAIRRTEELLDAMDNRFDYIVPFLPVYGMASRHLQARELFGLTMTEALAQEGQVW